MSYHHQSIHPSINPSIDPSIDPLIHLHVFINNHESLFMYPFRTNAYESFISQKELVETGD